MKEEVKISLAIAGLVGIAANESGFPPEDVTEIASATAEYFDKLTSILMEHPDEAVKFGKMFEELKSSGKEIKVNFIKEEAQK